MNIQQMFCHLCGGAVDDSQASL